MIGIIVVAHGELADGFSSAVELIIGKQEKFSTIGLNKSDSVDELPKRINTSIQELEPTDGVLIFTDLFGASPFNAAARSAHQSEKIPVNVITGVNLGMLLETIVSREKLSLEELTEFAKSKGIESIKVYIDPDK